ncbi:MAG TPA: FliH/SctL family protein [Pyrinomonadaceae bacterium]|nr:FliH/SctL family protein [Pyrinomonadaceae bacterium]
MSAAEGNGRNIIKLVRRAGTGAAPPHTNVIKRPLVEARAEARRLIAEAERDAAHLSGSAQRAARELREMAYQEGYEAALSELNGLLLEAHERRAAALTEVECDVLRLAIKVAEKIIGREIKIDPGAAAAIVSTALRSARRQELLTVRVHPADLPEVQSRRDQIDPAGRARFLDFVADSRVGRGGCIIESESGTVDARLDTQLRVLERALLARASDDNH